MTGDYKETEEFKWSDWIKPTQKDVTGYIILHGNWAKRKWWKRLLWKPWKRNIDAY